MGGGVDVAILEDNGCIAKDEVNRAVDITLTIKLLIILCKEGVLLGLKIAVVEWWHVISSLDSHGLALKWLGRVSEGDVYYNKIRYHHGCDRVNELMR